MTDPGVTAAAKGSTRVVLVALAGNLAIALIKAVAFFLTRSTAMLTEAIHSLVDTGDQVLLLIGQRRGARAADETHPFGYGMETYFWSFIVALMVFVMGGAVSIWQGVEKLLHPSPINRPWISIIVPALSAIFEGASFHNAYRAYRRLASGPRAGLASPGPMGRPRSRLASCWWRWRASWPTRPAA
jgi:cation diffusion facilitator family transporter